MKTSRPPLRYTLSRGYQDAEWDTQDACCPFQDSLPPLLPSSSLVSSGVLLTHRAVVDLLEEVVALVVHEDEGREVFDLDLPDGFHAELGKFDDFDFLDVVLGEEGGGAADGAEVEAAVFLAGFGDLWLRLPLAIMTSEPPRLWKRST